MDFNQENVKKAMHGSILKHVIPSTLHKINEKNLEKYKVGTSKAPMLETAQDANDCFFLFCTVSFKNFPGIIYMKFNRRKFLLCISFLTLIKLSYKRDVKNKQSRCHARICWHASVLDIDSMENGDNYFWRMREG